jgi:hypothetical protein
MSVTVDDNVYCIRTGKPVLCRVVAIKGDTVVLDGPGEELIWESLERTYPSRAEACIEEAARQRKFAASDRKSAAERLQSAETHEAAAVDLLREANALLRKQI